MFADLLLPMFDDEYYPDILVAEVKQHIERFAKKVTISDLSVCQCDCGRNQCHEAAVRRPGFLFR